MRWLDLPPVWLLGCLFATWLSPWPLPTGRHAAAGVVLLALAAVLTLAALVSFLAARTTFVPRRKPDALITSGVFRLTRNPIYLADLLVLAGFALFWGKALGLLLLPVLFLVLKYRFILGEEARLRAVFGPEFEAYAARTRRWL